MIINGVDRISFYEEIKSGMSEERKPCAKERPILPVQPVMKDPLWQWMRRERLMDVHTRRPSAKPTANSPRSRKYCTNSTWSEIQCGFTYTAPIRQNLSNSKGRNRIAVDTGSRAQNEPPRSLARLVSIH
jgi:hypothetical protein